MRYLITIVFCSALTFCFSQNKWEVNKMSVMVGSGDIIKKTDWGIGVGMHADFRKNHHRLGAEYETTTAIYAMGKRYSVDQINVLYGQVLPIEGRLLWDAFGGVGYYREASRRIENWDGETYDMKTGVGLKFKLNTHIPVYKKLHISGGVNTTFNFYHTYYSFLAGLSYVF